jgi:hypothetical protein
LPHAAIAGLVFWGLSSAVAPAAGGDTKVAALPAAMAGVGEAAAPPAASAPATAQPQADSMDFDLLPKEQPSDTAHQLKLESEVRIRRRMLQWHQALGIATTILMAGTVITGQLNYSDRYGGGTSTGRYEIWHTSFEAATVVSFTGDALLALFAPVPFPKHPKGVDTILIHKIAMFTTAAGFLAEIPLGIYTVSQEGHINQATFATTHLIIGYITAAALVAGVSALFFQ